MALNTVSSDRLSTNVKNTNFTAAEKQDLTDDILPLTGQLGNRNLIINGAMKVAQRGTSQTGVDANGYATVDRFQALQSGTDAYIEQHQVDVASGTTPYTSGFRKAFQVKNGNQTSGAGSSDQVYISHKMEAQDIANSGWNYLSSSSNITLSFWVKSSVAQNFYGYLITKDGSSYLYPFETGSLTADTWTKITKTIPGNSNITVNNDTGTGLELVIAPFFGTDKTGSVSLNAWGAYNSSVRMPDNTSTWYTTDDATFEITGVQLEVGSVATDFEHRSFNDDLRRCQRYYQEVGMSVQMAGGSSGSSAIGNVNVPIACAMRAAPTVASGITYHMWHGDNDGRNNNGTAMTVVSYGTSNPEHSVALKGNVSGFSGVTDNRSGSVCANSGTVIKLSAEL